MAICTPHFREVHARYTTSLLALVARTSATSLVFNGERLTPTLKVFMNSGSVLSDVRNTLVKFAIEWEANYLLWVDADHTFPPDSALRLLAHNLPVVGVNYSRRIIPTCPTATGLDGKLLWTTLDDAKAGKVEEVKRIGLGLCLMDMTILSRLPSPFWPLFSQEPVPGSSLVKGEDHYFFERLETAGIPLHVDHGLSWEIGHLSEIVLTNADAWAQRESYMAMQAPPKG